MHSVVSEVLAWAVDRASGVARHISEVATGRACNCVCPACGLPLLGVNAGRRDLRRGQRRPHFRHEQGVEKQRCRILAGRAALERTLKAEGVFELPARRLYRTSESISGEPYTHCIVSPAERVGVKSIEYDDEALASLVLDDGRRLKVVVRGTLRPGALSDSAAIISVELDAAEAAELNPQDLRNRIFLEAESMQWLCHWNDEQLRAQAQAAASALAKESADWLPEDLSAVPAEWRRESALHLAIKRIIEENKRMLLPPMEVAVLRQRNPLVAQRHWHAAAKEVQFDSVALEHRLGRIIPDVVASIGPHSMLIEVVVTNSVDQEKLALVRQLGLPCLEVNLSRSYGRVTFEELRRIVLEELGAKRWLHHPRVERVRAQLEQEVEDELDRKMADHIEAMRRNQSQPPGDSNVESEGSSAERYAAASGRAPRPFRPLPSDADVPVMLSGKALAQWKRDHPERYEELKKTGFFEQLVKRATRPTDNGD